jgi:hypothetical protein
MNSLNNLYFVLGTVEYAAPVEVTVESNGYSPLSLLKVLEDKTGYELRVRRNGETQYAIDFVKNIGSSALVGRVAVGLNLVELAEVEEDDGLVSAILPLGDALEVRATLGENAWLAGTVPGSAPYWIPLTDPVGGASPIQFDGQFGTASTAQPAYLLLKDATTLQITDSRKSDSAVLVAAATGLATSDLVQIVKDTSANRLLELTNPQISPRNAKVGDFTGRGERNLVRDGLFNEWTDDVTPKYWTAAGATPATVIARKYPRNSPVPDAIFGQVSVSIFGGNTVTQVEYKGATPGTKIFGGEPIQADTYNLVIRTSVGVHTVDGTGTGILLVNSYYIATAITINLDITLKSSSSRPASFPDDGLSQSYAALITGNPYTGSIPAATNSRLQSLPYKVKYVAGLSAITASVGFTYKATSGSGQGAMALIDTATGANGTVLGGIVSSLTWAGDAVAHETLACSISIVADKTLAIGVYSNSNLWTYVRWAMLSLGSATVPPPVGDSPAANKLWQRANRELAARLMGVRSITVTLRELAGVIGYIPSAETLVLGGSIYLTDLQTSVRVISILYDLFDFANTKVTLDSRPASLVRYLTEKI